MEPQSGHCWSPPLIEKLILLLASRWDSFLRAKHWIAEHSAPRLSTCLTARSCVNWLSPHLSADSNLHLCLPLLPPTFKTIVSFQFVSHRFVSCRTLTEGGLTISTYTLVINSYLLPSPEHSVGARWPVFLLLSSFFLLLSPFGAPYLSDLII